MSVIDPFYCLSGDKVIELFLDEFISLWEIENTHCNLYGNHLKARNQV